MKEWLVASMAILLISGVHFGCKPAVPPYPYKPWDELNATAQKMSDDTTTYIKDWVAGKVPALMPDSIVPDNVRNHSWYKGRGLTLKNPDLLSPSDKWGMRKAHIIDYNATRCLFPDPHCTYMIPTTTYGPFGTRVIVRGQFPKCRYFSMQITPPFDPRFYTWLGLGEVAIADADIIPDAGHINPFLPGANRNATNRNYTVTFEFKKGDISQVCGDQHKPPYYRYKNNLRYGTGLSYMGPWGDPNYPEGTHEGPWKMGILWLRYYAPDNYGKAGVDPLAGVGAPDIYCQLPTGEKFYCWSDPREFEKGACKTKPMIVSTGGSDPASFQDADDGWEKQWGIFHIVIANMAVANGMTTADDKLYIRNLLKGVTGCGDSQPAPGNWEPSESCANHIKYLVRNTPINTGKVYVLAGQLPTFPPTVKGNTTMTGGTQIRYFSICSYDQNSESDGDLTAGCVSTVMDEDIVLNAQRKYVICYSRPEDRPTNATSAAGVTWVNWGKTAAQGVTLRWLAVYPDWYMTDKTPDEVNATWFKTAWSSSQYSKSILAANNRNGLLREFQPIAYYLTKTSFQGLGTPVTEEKLKGVSWGCGTQAGNGIAGSILALVPLLLILMVNLCWFLRRKNHQLKE